MAGEAHRIALFNGPVVTTNGLYRVSDITTDEAQKLVRRFGIVSAVGHEAAAEALSELLAVHVPMRRIQFVQEIGQYALALKMNKRPPEGRILTSDEMEAVGYSLKLMERLE